MRILITGGFGYLGGRIAQSLSTQGHEVILGTRVKYFNSNWLPKAAVAQIDWNNPEVLLNICSGCDVIIHAAGMNSQDCLLDPKGAIEFNGNSTEKLVKASIVAKVKKLIYLSTAHVYCSPLHGEITEESPLLNNHPYATSHHLGELAVLKHSRTVRNYEGIVLRLSNGVGAPLHKKANCWMLAINDFCRQVIENRIIEVNSPAAVERDFFPIETLCKAINSIISLDSLNEEIINVSSSQTKRLSEIISIISQRTEKLYGFMPEVNYRNKDLKVSKSNLIISNDKLRKIINIEDSLELEIDKLLLKCNEWFGNE